MNESVSADVRIKEDPSMPTSTDYLEVFQIQGDLKQVL